VWKTAAKQEIIHTLAFFVVSSVAAMMMKEKPRRCQRGFVVMR
jgi:hypothetical protein